MQNPETMQNIDIFFQLNFHASSRCSKNMLQKISSFWISDLYQLLETEKCIWGHINAQFKSWKYKHFSWRSKKYSLCQFLFYQLAQITPTVKTVTKILKFQDNLCNISKYFIKYNNSCRLFYIQKRDWQTKNTEKFP